MTKTKVLFCGGKEIGTRCFEYLVRHLETFKAEIVGVVFSSRGQSLAESAKNQGIEVYSTYAQASELDFDLILSIQHSEILPSSFLKKAKRASINLHLAPLPKYRGCNQFSFAILNQETSFAVSLHEMNERVDAGKVIFEKTFSIPENIFVEDFVKLANSQGHSLFCEKLEELLTYKAAEDSGREPELKAEGYFYKRSDIEKIKKLDLNWPKEKIERHIRATLMPGFSGPYFELHGRKIELTTSGVQ
jgi:methionyl-tRNA formyltransferase